MKYLNHINLFIIFLFFLNFIHAQDVYKDFVKFGGTQNYFLKSATKTDALSNFYQAGATISPNGDYDVLITKYDRSGSELWSETYDNDGENDAAVDIFIDQNGNVYVAGTTFDSNSNSYNVLILKFSTSGTLIWNDTYNLSGSLYNVATSITGDNNNIYIGGVTYGIQNESDFLALGYTQGGGLIWNYTWDNLGLNDAITSIYIAQTALYVAGGTEIDSNKWKYCIQKLNQANGSQLSQNITGGTGTGIDIVTDLVKDPNGNIYVTGGVANINNGFDFKTVKLDSSLNILWAKHFNSGNSFDDIANSLVVDISGNVFVTGQSETLENGTNYNTIKYTSSGVQSWVKTYNGSGNGADTAKVAVLDINQNVIITGVMFNGSNQDFHTIKYAPNGDIIWEIDFNGLENNDDIPMDMVVDSYGDIIIVGQTSRDQGYTYTAIKYREVNVTAPFVNGEPTTDVGIFTENRGQLSDLNNEYVNEIKYYGWDRTARIFYSDTAMSYISSKVDSDENTLDTLCRVDIKPVSGNQTRPYSKERAKSFSNFYFSHLGDGRERVEDYKTIVYPEIWRDVDLTMTNGINGVDYYYVVKKGAQPNSLKWEFTGQVSLAIDSGTNDLLVETNCGTNVFPAPEAYQISTNGDLISLGWTPAYVINGNLVSLSTGLYNNNLPLVIALKKSAGGNYDENGLCWSTYFSSTGNLVGSAIQFDQDENILGSAYLDPGNFIFSGSATSPYESVNYNACIFNLFEDFEAEWMTFVGGSSRTVVSDFEQNSLGHIYCVGSSSAQDIDAVSVSGATSYEHSGEGSVSGTFAYDAFVFKCKQDNGSIMWSTFLGMSGSNFGNDFGKNIAVSDDDKVYVVGEASGSDFPTTSTSNSYEGGSIDVFLVEFDENDFHTWTYFLGGSNIERPYGLDVNESGEVWIHGTTRSSDFNTVNPDSQDLDILFDDQIGGISDDFVTHISPANQTVLYSTLIGGSSFETEFNQDRYAHTDYIAVSDDKVYFTGKTKSSNSTFPIMEDLGSFNFDLNQLGTPDYNSNGNGYIIAVDPNTYYQTWGTYMSDADNGDGSDVSNYSFSIHLITYTNDTPDQLLMCGSAGNPNEMLNPGGFDYFSNAYPTGDTDGFVYRFQAGLTSNSLAKSTFFGGEGNEAVRDIAFINDDQMAISGSITGVDTDNIGFPLDNPGGEAIFTDNLAINVHTHGFFSAFCEGVPVSVDENAEKNSVGLMIFPNPANSQVTVECGKSRVMSYSIYDISGRQVLSQTVNESNIFTIDLKSLESGSYIIIFHTETEEFSSKIIKL